MIIKVKVIPQAKKNNIKQEGDLLKVYVTAPAVDGKANDALIRVLCDRFQIKKKNVEIIKGLKSRLKTISINRF